MKKRILVISPHPDDETIALGGSIAKFIDTGSEVHILTISGHLPPLYDRDVYETTVKETKEAYKIMGVEEFKFLEIPATMVKDEPVHKLNGLISSNINEFNPEIVLIPFPDRHIDHRVIFDSCMVATRPVGKGKQIEMIATYETLSETHWNAPYVEMNFIPNLVVDVSSYIEIKVSALECFKSQISKNGPRSTEAIRALAKFRGSQSGFEYGEALYIIRKAL